MDEDAVRTYYDTNTQQFEQAATVQARHILVKEADLADAIKAELDAGLSFEEAASLHPSS